MLRNDPAGEAERIDLVSIDMGYGHLRPAHAIADFVGEQPILLADEAPLATVAEQRLWRRARAGYEMLSQAGRVPFAGPILAEVLRGVTSIPSLYPLRDLSSRTPAVRLLEKAAAEGLGQGLAARLQRSQNKLLTTFFGPAVLSDIHGCEKIFCVVTDSDINRVWAPVCPSRGRITYLAPSLRVRRRLKAYGVPSRQIVVTGFPLPHELVGGVHATTLRANLRRRLSVLDPKGRFLHECREEVSHFLGPLPDKSEEPPHLVFAVGGAGAQVELVPKFLPSLAPLLRKKKLRLTLVAGLRSEVVESFERAIFAAGLDTEFDAGQVSILQAPSHAEYFQRFNALLAETDVLWTKPSELSFFGALGIPLLFTSPVGSHERYNRRWVVSTGAGVKQGDIRHAGQWFREMLRDGTFAGAAWSGYMRLPKFGLYRVIEEVLGAESLARLLDRTSPLVRAV